MINGKDCRVTRQEIDESELNQRLSEQAQAHVASCVSCRGFRAERTSLRELVGSLQPVTAPGDFELRLRARLANEKQARTRRPFFFRFVVSTPAIAAAACVVVLALSVAWFSQRNVTQPTDIAQVPIIEKPLPNKTAIDPVASANQTATVNRADKPEREDRNPVRTAVNSRENGGRSPGVTARDYGSSPAQSYRQLQQRAGEVSLSAPLKPMVVSMQDDRGATRRISLPPVSFGAQRMVDNNNRISVSTTNSRSW